MPFVGNIISIKNDYTKDDYTDEHGIAKEGYLRSYFLVFFGSLIAFGFFSRAIAPSTLSRLPGNG